MSDPGSHTHDDVDADADASFDERAATWDDDPAKVERARVVAERIAAAVSLDGHTRLLDFGAGTGLLAQHLASQVGSITVADPSAGMREVMQQKVARGDLPDARVTDVDLSAAAGDRFDVAATLMALHHVPEPQPVLARLAEIVEPDGWLAIVDLEAEDGSFHGHGFDGHDGFDRDELTGWLRDAGFDDVAFTYAYDVVKNDRAYPLFLAVARRRDQT